MFGPKSPLKGVCGQTTGLSHTPVAPETTEVRSRTFHHTPADLREGAVCAVKSPAESSRTDHARTASKRLLEVDFGRTFGLFTNVQVRAISVEGGPVHVRWYFRPSSRFRWPGVHPISSASTAASNTFRVLTAFPPTRATTSLRVS